jgi:ABC-type antimicrobial peptide transport system permease subunit
MSFFTLVRRNLGYYWRTNLAVILGVATAVAVLSGALLVGDSVRESLRDLVLARLGKTEGVVTSAQFFREQLSNAVPGSAPMIAMQGVVTHEKDGRRAANVSVYGVDDRFWKFNGVAVQTGVELSAALARELGASPGDALLLRVEKPSAIPLESLHGRKDDPGRTIRLSVGATLEANQLGEFSLRPTQGDVFAIFVPLRLLQRDLSQQNHVNTLLLASSVFPRDAVTLDDLGVKVRSLPQIDGFSVESASGIISDALAEDVKKAVGLDAHGVFSYLANSIRIGDREIPYSLVAAVDALPGNELRPDSIYLNQWAAKDLGAKIGDAVTLDYYYWEPSGSLTTRSANFKLAGILPMSGIAIDRDLTPEYPGITEATSIGDWDPPFPVDLKRVRPRDEDYWKKYRTAPKAFIALATGQKLWGSRFGNATSIRVEGTPDAGAFAQNLRALIDPAQLGMVVYAPREQALQSAHGSTDFSQYFAYFSVFLVVSALLLAGLFFQLGIEQRLREIGTLRAVGFPAFRIRQVFVAEGLALSIVGTLLGTFGAVGYAAFLMYGLRTWWRGAVGTGLLSLHVSADSLGWGAIGGVAVAWLCVIFTLRSFGRSTARDLLSGQRGVSVQPVRASRRLRIVGTIAAVAGLAMIVGAFAHTIPDAAGFFGAGSLLLIAAICFEWARLRSQTGTVKSVVGLGVRNASHRPGRSVLSIALIASAVFLVVALDAFRRPPVAVSDPKSGAGGFPFLAESQLPLVWDPNTAAGRENLNIANITNINDTRFYAFRLRPGEDASCLNLYEPRTPRVLGARRDFVDLARFSFAESIGNVKNPWTLLDGDPVDGAIPAIADANSITYVLHKKIGDTVDVNGVKLRLVAALDDSIFQSELIVSDKDFVRVFPDEQGFRVFLIDGPPAVGPQLEEALGDYGFDVTSTGQRLAAYHRVENTYLSTFQALGGLGLLLGTLGLGAVLMRNVMERRKELALLRAVGYRPEHLRLMVMAENGFLLIAGTAIGAVCAFIAVAPAFIERGGHLPNPSLALLLLAVPFAGMAASLAAVRAVSRAPLLETLRAE